MHTPVLLNEVCELFNTKEEGIIIDCTLGLGGHTKALLSTNTMLNIIGIDKDSNAIEVAKQNLKDVQDRITILQGGFSEKISEAICMASGRRIIGILADIGVSSLQFDTLERGFSFKSSNLDMRMDTSQHLNAHYVLHSYSEFELERVFKEYGEIKEAKKLARIIKTKKGGFSSAQELSNFISLHFRGGKIHPATLAFQALRIEVNDELGALKRLLDIFGDNSQNLKGSIVAIISFHSLEDRIVKHYFKEWSRECICDENTYRCVCGGKRSKGKILTKKPLIPTMQEIRQNPRSRSSKLRAFQFK